MVLSIQNQSAKLTTLTPVPTSYYGQLREDKVVSSFEQTLDKVVTGIQQNEVIQKMYRAVKTAFIEAAEVSPVVRRIREYHQSVLKKYPKLEKFLEEIEKRSAVEPVVDMTQHVVKVNVSLWLNCYRQPKDKVTLWLNYTDNQGPKRIIIDEQTLNHGESIMFSGVSRLRFKGQVSSMNLVCAGIGKDIPVKVEDFELNVQK